MVLRFRIRIRLSVSVSVRVGVILRCFLPLPELSGAHIALCTYCSDCFAYNPNPKTHWLYNTNMYLLHCQLHFGKGAKFIKALSVDMMTVEVVNSLRSSFYL